MPKDDIYDPHYVRRLFDEMAATYGIVNLVSSLGFARRWRRQCIRAIKVRSGSHVLDLMTGMGELCPDTARLVGPNGTITAVDISPAMCERARRRGAFSRHGCPVRLVVGDALRCPLEDASVDHVVSSFGLKTFSTDQVEALAHEIARVLKPGGSFSLMEISVPRSTAIRLPYLAYVGAIIPLIGRLLLGNPDNYRLLAVYTRAFGDCRAMLGALEAAGLDAEFRSYFFGCATGLAGRKR